MQKICGTKSNYTFLTETLLKYEALLVLHEQQILIEIILLYKIKMNDVKFCMPNLKKILASLNDNQLVSKHTLAKVLFHLSVALLAFKNAILAYSCRTTAPLFLSLETQPAMHMHLLCRTPVSST